MTIRSLTLCLLSLLAISCPLIAAEPPTALGAEGARLYAELQRLDQALDQRLDEAKRRIMEGTFEAARLERETEQSRELIDRLADRIRGLDPAEAAMLGRKLKIVRYRVYDLEIAVARGVCPPAASSGASAASALDSPARIANLGGIPANDACENATVIGTLGTFTGDTSQATNDGEASCGSSLFGPDVWFKIEVAENGPVFIDTVGSAFDTVLSLHTACPGTLANEELCNDDVFGDASSVGFFGFAGDERWVRVSGFGTEAGAYTLNVGSGGSLSGAVTDAATSAPLAGTEVILVNADGFFVAIETTGADGSYTFDDLSPGGFYVRTDNSLGYIDELYDDIVCMPNCDATLGQLVLVENETETPGIDFALDVGGSVSGTLSDAAEGLVVANQPIELWDADGNFVNSTLTDGTGSYTFLQLLTGDYFVSTDTSGFLDELYDNLPCPGSAPGGCDPTTGTPVAVTVGATTTGIDFVLDRLGSISGRLTDAPTGDPLPNIRVEVFGEDGFFEDSAFTDSNGDYEIGGLAPGSYFVGTDGFFDNIDELYDDIPCPGGVPFGCDVTSGTPVVVSLNSSTTGIDFVLDRKGGISGTLTEVGSGFAIANVRVEIYSSSGSFERSAISDASGFYQVDDLFEGTYFARTEGNLVINELFDDLPCEPSCTVTFGTQIAVTANTTTPGIDFELTRTGSIAGTLTREDTGDPLTFRRVEAWDSNGNFAGSVTTDGLGEYQISGLDAGSYFVGTDISSPDLLDELYDDIPCFGGTPSGCDPTTGNAIPVALGTTTSGIDIALAVGGGISGNLTDAETAAPVLSGEVELFDAAGNFVRRAFADSSGFYRFLGLEPGTYFATAESFRLYVRELYDDLPCGAGCIPTTGTPIIVTGGSSTTGIDFALERFGVISGTVNDAVSGTLQESGFVDLYNESGNFVDSDFVFGGGSYGFDGLTAGTYFVRTSSFSSFYVEQLYDGLPCEGVCNVTLGTPIVVSLGSTITGIDFNLERRGTISGFVQSTSGAPARNVTVRFWNAAGNNVSSTTTDASGLYTSSGLEPGAYYATTSSIAWLDELYDGLPCEGGCDVTAGTPIPVAINTTTRHINFQLQAGGIITGVLSQAASGLPLSNRRVELFNSEGDFLRSDPTDSAGTYAFSGLATGTYFVATDVGSSFLDELYDDLPCPGGAPTGCDATSGSPIAVAPNATVSGIDFALESAGTLGGIVTDVDTGLPLSNLRVELWNESAQFVQSRSTNDQGSYQFTSLAPGNYFVTTDNFQGYLDELYDDLPCLNGAPAGCEPDKGTPIPIVANSVVTGIDFQLLLTATGLAGMVTEEATGEPLANVLIDIWNISGNRVTTAITSAAGTYFITLPADTYFASTDTGNGLLMDEVFDGLQCPGPAFAGFCDPLLGTAIEVMSSGSAGNPGVTEGIDFSLGSSILFEDGFESGDFSAWSNVTGGS